MIRNLGAGAILVAGILAAHPALALELKEATYENYQAYLKQIGATKHGAFAVSADGAYSWFYYCTETNCITTGIGQAALQKCQSLSGQECRIMANDRTLRMEFTVAP